MSPLNPNLYKALMRISGGKVKTTHQGERFSFVTEMRDGRPTVDPTSGELYHINCPFCNDTRGRLVVNYRYGTDLTVQEAPTLPSSARKLTTLAYCFNQAKTVPLYGRLVDHGYTGNENDSVSDLLHSLSFLSQPHDEVFADVPSMGNTIPLHELPRDHQAIQYLIGRGYDPDGLSRSYGLCLMDSHPSPSIERAVKGRIGFPFFVDGKLVQWQARLAYELPKGQRWPLRWYFPGGRKVMWNHDGAKQFPVVIICEGILSAVNFGPAAVAICGKSISYDMKQRLVKGWSRIVVALDPDAGINHREGEDDWQQRLIKELREAGHPEVSGVQWTPGDNRDPGDIGALACGELLRQADPVAYSMLGYYSQGTK